MKTCSKCHELMISNYIKAPVGRNIVKIPPVERAAVINHWNARRIAACICMYVLGLKWKVPGAFINSTLAKSLKRDAAVCLLTLLVALCRSEQLTADREEGRGVG